MSSPSQSFFDFPGLPKELRDQIYSEYVLVDGGYIFNPKTRQLKAADQGRRPHLMALQSTCKKIREETDGLALQHNIITFSTVTADDDPEWITARLGGAFDELIYRLYQQEWNMLQDARRHITNSIKDRMGRQYPQFLPVLEDLQRGTILPPPRPWRVDGSTHYGEIRSIFREFVHRTLRHIAEEFPEALPSTELLDICHEPWVVPTEDILAPSK